MATKKAEWSAILSDAKPVMTKRELCNHIIRCASALYGKADFLPSMGDALLSAALENR